MLGVGVDRRRIAAVAAIVAASAASVASLDEGSPPVTSTSTLGEQSAVLTETSPPLPVTVRVAAAPAVGVVSLTVHLDASWGGFADAGQGDAGAPDEPIVEATLAGLTLDGGGEPDAAVTLDRAITMAPGTGALILSADAPCAPTSAGCEADFTFTLDRIEPVRSGPVSVTWTAAASVTYDTSTVLRFTVSP
jgi:hypothetical protein